MEASVRPEQGGFLFRVGSMLRVDLRRILKSPFLYIILAICLVMPIVILVMTTMMDGMESVNPQTGEVTVTEGFDSVWQIIGSTSEGSGAAGEAQAAMSITSMCNINMLYFGIAVLVCVFVADDFRSGYSKNLFTVRARKSDYVISKTIVLSLGAAAMILLFFIGSMLGGAISNLSFDMVGFGAGELVLCILSKMILVTLFVPIYLVMSVTAKKRLWLSLILSFGVGMFLFMMIPMITPLDSTPINLLLAIAGGALFSLGLGSVSKTVLNKTSLV